MDMKLPAIIINFKAYESAINDNALRLAKICEKVTAETGVTIYVCTQTADIYRVSKETDVKVIAEHVDPVNFGPHTGWTLPENVKANGAIGTLINHSEHRIDMDLIKSTITRAKEAGLITIACAENPEEAVEIAGLSPDIVAIELPELIGGDVSVTKADPGIVSNSVKLVQAANDVPVVCGAGVHDSADVKKAIELGTAGVLLASGVTKSDDPEKVIRELAEGLR